MAAVDTFFLKVKRGESPFYRALRSVARTVLYGNLPVPRVFYPLLRVVYRMHRALVALFRWAVVFLYYEPLFRSRCASAGRRLRIDRLPYIYGHTRIHIGNDVCFSGHVAILSGRILDEPALILKDGVHIGHLVQFSVNREIVVEENVKIASNCSIADTDGHPLDPELRARNLPPAPADIKPVRICRNAWISQGTYVLKGVTIGEAAIVSANSTVVSDIPPYCIAMGNPARVVGFAAGRAPEPPADVPAVGSGEAELARRGAR